MKRMAKMLEKNMKMKKTADLGEYITDWWDIEVSDETKEYSGIMYDRGYVSAKGVQYVGLGATRDEVSQHLYNDTESEYPLLEKLIKHLQKEYPGATIIPSFDTIFIDNLQISNGEAIFEFEGVIEFDKDK
jgi:hypothetical protein